MDRGAWRSTYSPWGHKESDTTEKLSTHMHAKNIRFSFVCVCVSCLRQCSISCTSAVDFCFKIWCFLIGPVEFIKMNRDLMGEMHIVLSI